MRWAWTSARDADLAAAFAIHGPAWKDISRYLRSGEGPGPGRAQVRARCLHVAFKPR
jgi:hypothetical protein